MDAPQELAAPGYRRELGNGLVVRWSDARDTPGIAELSGYVFRRAADEPPNSWVMAWIRDLMSGVHPHMGPGDFGVVEEAATSRIVSAACLLSYEVEMEGVRLPFGRPEIVATHPDFRNRGLVRATFELLHARSDARGHALQGITGIPYYYRLFGYEYAADLGGEVSVPFPSIPQLKAGDAEPYLLRRASADELGIANELYDRDRARYALSSPMTEEFWRWTGFGQSPETGEGWTTRLVVDKTGAAVGYVLTANTREADEIKVEALGVKGGMSLAAALPSILRGLVAASSEPLPRREGLPAPARVCLLLWRDHPVYSLLGEAQIARRTPPYAWYLRVPDLPDFLMRIRAVLERRLAGSALAGYTGELRLSFYRDGLRLAFDGGRLTTVEPWRQDHAWGPRSQAGFPPFVFLKLLFGHRSLGELKEAFPDVNANDEARPLLEALFPARPSWLLPLG
jgi:hypothetical protein